ncbi:helix-turn-helix domain-containing protein [Subsaximicrobium wynnwilliamsii]|uniref:Helix-turn-helix domain-containing protein n=1 Tax=Subsaximicrobium wynnwilliamsii TaxID=291179 RepID=A0A5C6ZDC7_9FLAO|nr:helix-turn-helix domain-containing protein [Subsaximicrobium wynnwilliamsii]TXD81500.1 helix-turn-helix domain-containing protein [Subsaximicrobium wynnwilliamsii]TXD87167.1 helix-turn-helix domain-containing protein [Subsaximicrobium wynnwilliamsii]TXE00860.1 helix-turn-helix domain-containing protein [Subsaximicrobium wynnwilliamsii]
MGNRLQTYRLEQNMTQTDLAEKAGLSLRTIQRIESGAALKGFTLQSIAAAFGIPPEKLTQYKEDSIDLKRVKIINLSALSFFIIPFGNIILPSILTYKSKDDRVKTFGKDIISVQIIWSVVTSILMIIFPFLQNLVSIKSPLFLIMLVLLICLNVFLIFKNSQSLTRNSTLHIKLKNSLL